MATYYKIVGIAPGRIIEHQRKLPGVPSEAVMIDWAKRAGCTFVGRYYPTRKGWRALRIDKAVLIQFGGSTRRGWKGCARGQRVWPTEDAMVMHLMILLGSAPDA